MPTAAKVTVGHAVSVGYFLVKYMLASWARPPPCEWPEISSWSPAASPSRIASMMTLVMGQYPNLSASDAVSDTVAVDVMFPMR